MSALGLALWAVGGAVLSGLHWLVLVVFVAGLDPEMEARQIRRRVRRSYLVRYGTLTLVLVLAVQQSAAAAIAAIVGYGVARAVLALRSVRGTGRLL